ncbi:ATP-binding cassette domain-containing protein [Paucisalibacillus sp. EB02]|uniref:ATP-binding cassette domain-containing protein n=1 Tax=Paucisalibacillus sp. EB02 TaxID=1347087 RepID=UPI001E40FF14|nr:ATP-binding cassette domain-containing protein [Paucisalibacillus sp. EB02]
MIKNVRKQYRKKVALDNVSLTIPAGSCFGLVGPNGAGKSTLLKILASIVQDYQGNIHIISKNDQLRKIAGYVPQEICLEQTLSAYSNLYFYGKLYGLSGKELKKRATEVLHDIGLSGRGKDKVMHFGDESQH